jgi:hypothetical protein
MKNFGSVLLLIIAVLVTSGTAASEQAVKGKKVVGVILEMSPDGEMIQIGKYSVADIAAVTIRDGNGLEKNANPKDLFSGALVEAVLEERNEQRFWRASSVILLLEGAQEAAFAELDADQAKRLKKTQNNLIGSRQDNPVPEKTDAPETPPQQDDLHLENGVWVN